jgi:hypothetical protein
MNIKANLFLCVWALWGICFSIFSMKAMEVESERNPTALAQSLWIKVTSDEDADNNAVISVNSTQAGHLDYFGLLKKREATSFTQHTPTGLTQDEPIDISQYKIQSHVLNLLIHCADVFHTQKVLNEDVTELIRNLDPQTIEQLLFAAYTLRPRKEITQTILDIYTALLIEQFSPNDEEFIYLGTSAEQESKYGNKNLESLKKKILEPALNVMTLRLIRQHNTRKAFVRYNHPSLLRFVCGSHTPLIVRQLLKEDKLGLTNKERSKYTVFGYTIMTKENPQHQKRKHVAIFDMERKEAVTSFPLPHVNDVQLKYDEENFVVSQKQAGVVVSTKAPPFCVISLNIIPTAHSNQFIQLGRCNLNGRAILKSMSVDGKTIIWQTPDGTSLTIWNSTNLNQPIRTLAGLRCKWKKFRF